MTNLNSPVPRVLGSRSLAVPCALALGVVTLAHLVDGPGSLSDVPYIGVLELALAAACVPLAVVLVMRPTRAGWLTVNVLLWTALGFYIASRTIGLPASSDDIGNWGQTWGVVNLSGEMLAIAIATVALARGERPSPQRALVGSADGRV